MNKPLLSFLCGFLFLTAPSGWSANDSWLQPFPAHRIAGNLYYVGSRDLASYLIATPEGHILLNSSLEESVPLIKQSVAELGFRFSDIRILLISHAHSDHCAGSAQILEETGAKYFVMDADADTVETGGSGKLRSGRPSPVKFPQTKVDRRLKDGEQVALGGSSLVAHLTAGHTRGCTTWSMEVKDDGKTLNAVIIGSPNVNPGYVLVDNLDYPEIAADYRKTFLTLRSLPVDLFLGAHGSYYGMGKKHALRTTSAVNPFIDPEGYHAYVSERDNAFQKELAKQTSAKP